MTLIRFFWMFLCESIMLSSTHVLFLSIKLDQVVTQVVKSNYANF